MNSYRGIEYEVYKDLGTVLGYIVNIGSNEIYCNTLDAVYDVIDEYLD